MTSLASCLTPISVSHAAGCHRSGGRATAGSELQHRPARQSASTTPSRDADGKAEHSHWLGVFRVVYFALVLSFVCPL